jgi:competence protein ComEC
MVEEFRQRPLLLLFLGLVVGLSSAWGAWNLLLAVPLLWSARSLRGSVAVFVGLAVGWATRPTEQPLVTVLGGVVDGTVEVVTMPASTRSGFLVTVEAPERRYRLFFADDPPVIGDWLRLRAEIEPLTDPEYRRRGEAAFLRPVGPVEVVREGWPVWRAAQGLQESFVGFVTREAHPRAAPMLAALCFNVTSGLDPAVRQALRRSGTIHLVSASGLHVALVGALVLALLSGLPVPRWTALALTAALLVLYAGATGLRAPMVRSVAMFAPLAVAYLARGRAQQPGPRRDRVPALGARGRRGPWVSTVLHDRGRAVHVPS